MLTAGQWIGIYDGVFEGNGLANLIHPHGTLVLNLDKGNSVLIGQVIMADISPRLPAMLADIEVTLDGQGFHGRFNKVRPIDPHTYRPVSTKEIQMLYPGTYQPKQGTIEGKIECAAGGDKFAVGEWSTDIKTSGRFHLRNSSEDGESRLKAEDRSWQTFKDEVVNQERGRYIFRGQEKPHRLRTSFHRTGNWNLSKYKEQNTPKLRHHLTATSGYKFDLDKKEDFTSLLSLGQHHGYPTPFLDWTNSPYIAAYFAFEGVPKNETKGAVRIFCFDLKEWKDNTPQTDEFTSPILTITPLDILPINNNRAVPQQAVTTFSNLDDIEFFIKNQEELKKKAFLRAIDIPVTEREIVMADLSHMGITAATMFPGLDGVCRALREDHF